MRCVNVEKTQHAQVAKSWRNSEWSCWHESRLMSHLQNEMETTGVTHGSVDQHQLVQHISGFGLQVRGEREDARVEQRLHHRLPVLLQQSRHQLPPLLKVVLLLQVRETGLHFNGRISSRPQV